MAFGGKPNSGTADQDLKSRIAAKNVGSTTAPAWGIVEISDVQFDTELGRAVVEVRRPTADNVKTIAIVCEAQIPAGGHGIVSVVFPNWVLYDTVDGEPALNEQWGPQQDNYTAAKGKIGFLAIPISDEDDPPIADIETSRGTARAGLWMLEVCRS